MGYKRLPEDILKKVSKSNNLPTHVIDRVARSQFDFLKNRFKDKKDFTHIRLSHLGIWYVPKVVVYKLIKNLGYNKEEVINPYESKEIHKKKRINFKKYIVRKKK